MVHWISTDNVDLDNDKSCFMIESIMTWILTNMFCVEIYSVCLVLLLRQILHTKIFEILLE